MRTKSSVSSRARRKKTLSKTKGMSHSRRTSYRLGKQAVIRSLQYSYRDRRNRKREFRKLWIIRIDAAARQNNTKYSTLMGKLRKANVELDRKVLSELASNHPKVIKIIIGKTS